MNSTRKTSGAKPAGGKSAAPKTTRAKAAPPAPGVSPTPEERWKMISDAAYYIAEKRGFVGGDPAQDWCEAERQIEERLKKG